MKGQLQQDGNWTTVQVEREEKQKTVNYSGSKIDPSRTLLLFDEIQEVPQALSSLKYWYENA